MDFWLLYGFELFRIPVILQLLLQHSHLLFTKEHSIDTDKPYENMAQLK